MSRSNVTPIRSIIDGTAGDGLAMALAAVAVMEKAQLARKQARDRRARRIRRLVRALAVVAVLSVAFLYGWFDVHAMPISLLMAALVVPGVIILLIVTGPLWPASRRRPPTQ